MLCVADVVFVLVFLVAQVVALVVVLVVVVALVAVMIVDLVVVLVVILVVVLVGVVALVLVVVVALVVDAKSIEDLWEKCSPSRKTNITFQKTAARTLRFLPGAVSGRECPRLMLAVT